MASSAILAEESDYLIQDGIYTTKVRGVLPDSYQQNLSQVFVNAPGPVNALLNFENEVATFNTLHSAYLLNKDCRIKIENQHVKACWYFDDSSIDVQEPSPISLNIPEGSGASHLFGGTIRNVYSTSDTNKGLMAYLSVRNDQRTINGWVRVNEGEKFNIYDVLNSASLTQRKITVAVHTLNNTTFITGIWYE